jgi:glycosyltransferase involved in cell wall biosynthesis
MKITFKILKTGSGNDVYFSSLSKELNKINIATEVIYYHKLFQYFPFLLLFSKKKASGTIIHTNAEYGWVFKEENKPLVVTLHHCVFDKEFLKHSTIWQRIYYFLILKPNIRKSLEIADKIIAVSNYTKNSFIKVFGITNIAVIYNFIDTEIFRPIKIKSEESRFRLIFVGNLIARKGADLLPQIMNALGDNYVLYYTKGLRSKIPETFKIPNMIPLGKLSTEELVVEYNKSDALLFPTRLEGFGYAVGEAMACNIPVLASNNSSIPELAVNGKNGYLFEVENINNVVECIRKLESELKSAKKTYDNRSSIIEKFGITRIIKEYETIYNNF